MNELNEIRFGDQDIFLSNNLVKTNILPESSKDLARNINIRGSTIIEGSVFGYNIIIEDGVVLFKGAVYADNELHIRGDVSSLITFKKAVASADSVAAMVVSGRVLFCSDINSPSVKLKNCYVGGSVFGTEVYLENCVVLGGVFAAKKISINNCVVGTFNAPTVELAGISYLLYPAAFSVEPVAPLPMAELWNLSIAHLGALYKGDEEAEKTGKIKMNLETDNQRTVLLDDNGATINVNSYSISGRVLAADLIDFDKLENHFLIGAGALNSQILKVYSLTKENGEKSEPLEPENIADFFFKIINGTVQIREASGSISFSELKKSLE